MSDSNKPKHVPLVFDEDLKGPIFNNAERNSRIEEQRRRDRERAARSATSSQSIELVSNQSQSGQPTNEPSTGASTSDPSNSVGASDSSSSASAPESSKSASTSRKSGNQNALRHGGYFRGLCRGILRKSSRPCSRASRNIGNLRVPLKRTRF